MKRTICILFAALLCLALSAADGLRLSTVVIDAGHGGMDGGAVSGDGLKESEVNLAIAQKMYDLCRVLGLDCAMTRCE